MPVCRSKPTSDCALPTELHGTPYIFIHHTSSWQPHQPTATTAEPIRTIGLAIRILYYSFSMLRCYRNHSAFNSHNLPSDLCYYLSVQYVAVTQQPVVLSDSEITFSRWQYFTTLLHVVSFHTIWLFASSLFRCRFSSGLCTSLATFRWVTVSSPLRLTRHPSSHCVFSIFSLLAGIVTTRPSAFAEGEGFEPSMFALTVNY